jgi:hypothetical protein
LPDAAAPKLSYISINDAKKHGMGLMAWLLAAIVFLVPLIFFPRAAGYILLAAALLLAGWAVYEWQDNARTLAEEEKVTITPAFDPSACTPEEPVIARATNGSNREVLSVRFDIAVKRRGYGNEIGRLSRLLDDKPMLPGARTQYCYALPVLIPPVDPAELEFAVPVKFVTFK